MTGAIRMRTVQRRGHLPSGCSPLAPSTDPEELFYALQTGNRATRREAARKMVKLARKTIAEGREL